MRLKFKLLILASFVFAVAGCAIVSSGDRFDAAHDAVLQGRIAGLSSAGHYTYMPWSFPSVVLGPYTKIDGVALSPTNRSANAAYVIYLGKSRDSGSWEVFAAMAWTNSHWHVLPVSQVGSAGAVTLR